MKKVTLLFSCLLVSVSSFSTGGLVLEPLLTNALQEASSSSFHVGGLSTASQGVRVWRKTLEKGHLPVEEDFDDGVWPCQPLYSNVCQKMVELQLPRFVLNHPETTSFILLSIIRMSIEFYKEVYTIEDDTEFVSQNENAGDKLEEGSNLIDYEKFTEVDVQMKESTIDQVAKESTEMLDEEYGDVINGVSILDQLFGLDHELLEANQVTSDGSVNGFGLADGVWQHSGWKEIPALQSKIAAMPEVKDLLKKLGRRPTAEDSNGSQKFAPRKPNVDGAMGAEFDPNQRESVSGVTLSGSFSEMLPSEAVLLRGSPALRRLFLAKKVEAKLSSYEMSGWTDLPSLPRTKPIYHKRLPSAPGGPIIVCLDTSWSMGGMREQLSKAVVLGCVSEAHKQGRYCQVVAFSTEHGTMEAGQITADNLGIQRLLEFLSHSFGGGTDVTGALKFAMTTIESDAMSAADILLISDGEIPDPPISDELMEKLNLLKLRKDVKVHGLLVGKRDSRPMSKICCETHDFLEDYDLLPTIGVMKQGRQTVMGSSLPRRSSSRDTLSRTRMIRKFFVSDRNMEVPQGRGIILHAKMPRYDDEAKYKTRKKQKKNKWVNDEEDYEDEFSFYEMERNESEKTKDILLDDNFSKKAQSATDVIKLAAEEKLKMERWTSEELIKEGKSTGSQLVNQSELKRAIDKVESGLVERSEESRLVVLSMIANEHILLLGVPGTGKSVLGRRLARLCDGNFFQRLLTRFSTPDELFGPLSLKSLENDEYRRCTDGFLPTASIAFLDEIFKANSAILNTLLTILNERKFDNAGGQEDCPIRCVVGASNELPESDDLVALFDRFLIRKEVLPLSNEGAFKLLSMSNPGFSPCDNDESEDIDLQEVVQGLSKAVNFVEIGDHICKLMVDLRTYMKEEHDVEISDRRLAKVARLLKISAATHGRQRVDPVDCLLLQHCLWQLPEERRVVRQWLWDNMTPGVCSGKQFRFLLDNLRREIVTVVRKTGGDITGEYGAREADIALLQSLKKETTNLISILRNQQTNLARHIELLDHAENYLWMDCQESLAMKQFLLPIAEVTASEVNKALTDAESLGMCLIPDTSFDPSPEFRVTVIEKLWEEGALPEVTFSDEDLKMGMKEAKAKYDLETFRKWKRIRKRNK